MSCDRRRGRQPPAPPGAGLQSATRECVYGHSQSKSPRSQSAPNRLENPNTHKRQRRYEGSRTKEKVDAFDLDGEPQPSASSCTSGIYEKLDESKRQIRILELHPGSGEESVSGHLITVDLPVLPLDFDESIFIDELSRISNDTVFAVRSGNRVLEDDLDRWEYIHDALIWLLACRFVESFHILLESPRAPKAKIVDQLRSFGISSSSSLSELALAVQGISSLLETRLSKCVAYHSWTHDLIGLTRRFSRRSRDRRFAVRFAEQLHKAFNIFVSEDSDGVSALTPVDVYSLARFTRKICPQNTSQFVAISWFWGDAKHRDKMELDGIPLDIPFNAKCALRDLRDSVHSKRLWIDAVCINQDDKSERASQILLMSDIYSQAALTYVWLGNNDPVTQQAICNLKLLRCLSSYVEHVDAADVPESASSARSVRQILDNIRSGHRITRTQWQYMLVPSFSGYVYPLFDLPWFGRLWVFQEAALSRRCLIVFDSNTTLPWEDLWHGMGLIFECTSFRGRGKRGLILIAAVVIHRHNLRNGSRLLKLAIQNEHQDCSDPRDHIFGVLGLTVWAKHRLRWPHLIQPSYTKPVSDCMRDATRVMIEQECDLSVLLRWREVEQSPTWAVHWHRHKHIRGHPGFSGLCPLDQRPLDLNLMHESPDLNILLLKGHSIDFVHSTTALFDVDEDEAVIKREDSGLAALELALRRIMDLSARTGFEFSPHTITLTLLACGHSRRLRSTSETEDFYSLVCVVSNVWDGIRGRRSERCLDLPTSDMHIFGQFCGVYRPCRLFTTQAGQLCVGPGGAQEGDKVVGLFGLDLAALLRPEQSWFTFAGVAYLDREFPVVHDTSTLPPEIFEIR